MEPTATLARRFWEAIEPIHAIVCFAPEPAEAAREIGLRGGLGELSGPPVERLGETGVNRAIDLAAPVSRRLIDNGVVPAPSPIGAPRP